LRQIFIIPAKTGIQHSRQVGGSRLRPAYLARCRTVANAPVASSQESWERGWRVIGASAEDSREARHEPDADRMANRRHAGSCVKDLSRMQGSAWAEHHDGRRDIGMDGDLDRRGERFFAPTVLVCPCSSWRSPVPRGRAPGRHGEPRARPSVGAGQAARAHPPACVRSWPCFWPRR
jgi:hypothetical protein